MDLRSFPLVFRAVPKTAATRVSSATESMFVSADAVRPGCGDFAPGRETRAWGHAGRDGDGVEVDPDGKDPSCGLSGCPTGRKTAEVERRLPTSHPYIFAAASPPKQMM